MEVTDFDYVKKVNERERKKYAELLTTDDKLLTRGECLKKYRILSGYTINTLSIKASCSNSQLGLIENDNSSFSISRGTLIAEILNIEPSLIILTDEDRQKEKYAELLKAEDHTLSIGERIRKYRVINNYLPAAFAKLCDINSTHLCNIEKNKYPASNKLLCLFASKLNLDISLFCGTKNVNNYKQIPRLHKIYTDLLQTEDDLLSTGKLIRKYRLLKGLTTDELSDKMDISPSLLNNIENDKANISLGSAKKLKIILNLDTCRLYTKSEENNVNRIQPNEELCTSEDILLSIGQRIKKYRIIKGYSVSKLAEKLGVSEPFLVTIEKGIGFLVPERAKKAALILGIDIVLLTPTLEDRSKQKEALLMHKEKKSKRLNERKNNIQRLLSADDSGLSIGEIIRKYRVSKGYTLNELSKEVDITRNYLGQCETNKLKLSSKSISKIADVLGIDVSLLMVSEEEQQKIDFAELLQTDNEKLSIGERIKKYRIINGYTPASFAKIYGINKPYLINIEKGIQNASLKLTKKIAAILNINYTEIYLSEEDEEKRKSCYILKLKKNRIERYSKLLDTDDCALSLGDRIKKYRTKNGYTITEISNLLGIKYSVYNSYEKNKNRPTKDILRKISEVFNIDISLIYEKQFAENA